MLALEGGSRFRKGRLKRVSTHSRYLEQNVRHSSAMYPSAIDPSGYALLRTKDLYRPNDLSEIKKREYLMGK